MNYEFWEHISTIFAWPLVFALVILTQQKAIAELIRRATKFRFKWGKAELLFEEGVKRIDRSVKVVEKQQELEVVEPRTLERLAIAAPRPAPVPVEEPKSHERLEEFTGKPAMRPSALVETSWQTVMAQMRNLLVAKGHAPPGWDAIPETLIAMIMQHHLLPSSVIDSISALYATRIQVNGELYFEPELDKVMLYVQNVDKINRAIARYI